MIKHSFQKSFSLLRSEQKVVEFYMKNYNNYYEIVFFTGIKFKNLLKDKKI